MASTIEDLLQSDAIKSLPISESKLGKETKTTSQLEKEDLASDYDTENKKSAHTKPTQKLIHKTTPINPRPRANLKSGKVATPVQQDNFEKETVKLKENIAPSNTVGSELIYTSYTYFYCSGESKLVARQCI